VRFREVLMAHQKTYEYDVIRLKADHLGSQAVVDALNEAGQKGWHLKEWHPYGSQSHDFLMERETSNPSAAASTESLTKKTPGSTDGA
jgi:hypothetical protein